MYVSASLLTLYFVSLICGSGSGRFLPLFIFGLYLFEDRTVKDLENMVRTKDTAGVKVAGAKASRKGPPPAPASPAPSESGSSKNKYAGGNPYCPRETPAWQKPITQFFVSKGDSPCGGSSSSSVESAGSSEQPGTSSDAGN